MNVDSTNMRPQGWLAIAGEVRRRYGDFDGFVVLHGTDTLAYTAAGLAYLVQGSPKPVVLTGSQLPMGDPATDGKRNLLDAVRVACDDAAADVMVAFGGKVISGTAARKVRTRSIKAFDSLNVSDLGCVRGGRVEWAAAPPPRRCWRRLCGRLRRRPTPTASSIARNWRNCSPAAKGGDSRGIVERPVGLRGAG